MSLRLESWPGAVGEAGRAILSRVNQVASEAAAVTIPLGKKRQETGVTHSVAIQGACDHLFSAGIRSDELCSQHSYGLDAVNYHTGETVVLFRRRKRRREVAELLQTLVDRHPTATIYVAWDNANTH